MKVKARERERERESVMMVACWDYKLTRVNLLLPPPVGKKGASETEFSYQLQLQRDAACGVCVCACDAYVFDSLILDNTVSPAAASSMN